MTHYTLQLKLRVAIELGEQLVDSGRFAQNVSELTPVHAELGLALMMTGEFAAAEEHFDRAFAGEELAERELGGPFYEANFYPAFRTWTFWALGYSDRAREWNRTALAIAEKIATPARPALALCTTALFCMFLRDPLIAQGRPKRPV